MKKISIASAHKGYNYGTSLQAYAIKKYFQSLDYKTDLVWYKKGIFKGRDIRAKKLFIMFLRTFWRWNLLKKTYLTYNKSFKKNISDKEKQKFIDFEKNILNVQHFSWRELKTHANRSDVVACICGSDQIWNATNIYLDPIYYLRFAPQEKRVAYAPSFGKSEIPNYNKKKIQKYVSDINYLSVREQQGADIITEITNRESTVVLDPTLLLHKEQWRELLDEYGMDKEHKQQYILLYFLDKPSTAALSYINQINQESDYCLISIPQVHEEFKDFKNILTKETGPIEFVDLILNADFVFTDSFHGTAFSINFNIPFYTFKREYGTANDQSSRITSLLNRLNLEDRFISQTLNEASDTDCAMSYEESNMCLDNQRIISEKYIRDSLKEIESGKSDKNERTY